MATSSLYGFEKEGVFSLLLIFEPSLNLRWRKAQSALNTLNWYFVARNPAVDRRHGYAEKLSNFFSCEQLFHSRAIVSQREGLLIH
jgi:hypothetical protein